MVGRLPPAAPLYLGGQESVNGLQNLLDSDEMNYILLKGFYSLHMAKKITARERDPAVVMIIYIPLSALRRRSMTVEMARHYF